MTEAEAIEAAAQRIAELWSARMQRGRSLTHILTSNLLALVACVIIFPGFVYLVTRGSIMERPHVFATIVGFLIAPLVYVGGQEARVAIALTCDGLPQDFLYYAPLEIIGVAVGLFVPVGFFYVYARPCITNSSTRLEPSYAKFLLRHPILWLASILMIVGGAFIEAG